MSKESKNKKSLTWFRDIAQQHKFDPLASEDWHFDHQYTQSIRDSVALARDIESQFHQDYTNSSAVA